MNTEPHNQGEGERRKSQALATLAENRAAYVHRARRALLVAMLAGNGRASADDVRRLVELPAGIDPKLFGSVPGPLARANIIRHDGFTITTRPVGHARPVTLWRLVNRSAAERWLATHPDVEPDPDGESAVERQGLLFPLQETATPTGATAGAAL